MLYSLKYWVVQADSGRYVPVGSAESGRSSVDICPLGTVRALTEFSRRGTSILVTLPLEGEKREVRHGRRA
jgi:hypothetical protein